MQLCLIMPKYAEDTEDRCHRGCRSDLMRGHVRDDAYGIATSYYSAGVEYP
jgi:hypothetical protein